MVKKHQSRYVIPIQGKNPFTAEVFPNPARRTFTTRFTLAQSGEVHYYLTNTAGKIVSKGTWNLGAGTHYPVISLPDEIASGAYSLTLAVDGIWYTTLKVMLE